MDALYASRKALALIESKGYAYLIRLQNKKIPTITQAIMAKKALPATPDGSHFYEMYKGYPVTEYVWAKGIKYGGRTLTGLYMHEKLADNFPFMYITNLPIESQEDAIRACLAGRNRWLIENNGFRFQKQLMHMTHMFSKNDQAMKCHYLLIQIAHMVCQFLELTCPVLNTDDGSEGCGMKRFLQSLTKSLIKNANPIYNKALVRFETELCNSNTTNSVVASASAVCSSVKMAS
jgi:hypothetical protein